MPLMKKSTVVTLRLTPAEREALEKARGKVSVSDYLRKLIAGQLAPKPTPDTTDTTPPAKVPRAGHLAKTPAKPDKLVSRCIICGSFPHHLANCPRG